MIFFLCAVAILFFLELQQHCKYLMPYTSFIIKYYNRWLILIICRVNFNNASGAMMTGFPKLYVDANLHNSKCIMLHNFYEK